MLSEVILVDWLGRGGIFQTSQSWLRTLDHAGVPASLVSRRTYPGAERKHLPGLLGGFEAHVRLVRRVVADVLAVRPAAVYLQNYLVPVLERRVAVAAHSVGARVVLAVHNHRPHERRAGLAAGLRSLLESVDDVVVHSRFVEKGLRRYGWSFAPTLIEHPAQHSVLDLQAVPVPELARSADDVRSTGVTFGVLGRRYKQSDVLLGCARAETPHWRIVAAGVGASEVSGAEVACDRFLSDAELRWVLEDATVALLPYQRATQSGAVVLGQVLGTPPVVSAVGGIPEQVVDGETGLLVPPGADVMAWRARLKRIRSEPEWWSAVADNARKEALARDARASAQLLSVLRWRSM